MSEITREEFAAGVNAAISGVHHLYREVHRMTGAIRESLGEAPHPLLAPVLGAMVKASRDQSRTVVRNEYGLLFTSAADEDVEEDEEEVDEEEGDEEGNEDKPARKTGPVEIGPTEVLLGIRVVLYDPRQRDGFEPQVSWAAMSDWATVGDVGKASNRYILARDMLRRIPKALGSADITAGARLQTNAAVKSPGKKVRARERRLSCRLPKGIETVPLYSLDSRSELDRVAAAMKAMWNAATQAT